MISSSVSAPLALTLGLTCGLSGLSNFSERPHLAAAARRWSARLLQLSVIALGFGFDLQAVMRAGERGLFYTAAGIACALLLGQLLARWLRVDSTPALLIAVGTAICGGSAIAAIGPAIDAKDEDLSVALGTVFILNAVALFLFPIVGAWFGLSESQFGLWAALAIHDTSSVIGAGLRYGPIALATATTVKLARALWIVPVTIVAASVHGSPQSERSERRASLPWFVLGFIAAAALAQAVPSGAALYAMAARAGIFGLSAALFLIGTQLTPSALRRVGWRALALGLLLWIIVATVSLWLVKIEVVTL